MGGVGWVSVGDVGWLKAGGGGDSRRTGREGFGLGGGGGCWEGGRVGVGQSWQVFLIEFGVWQPCGHGRAASFLF